MFKSTQTTIQMREDGCRYRTIIEETCSLDQQSGEQKCQIAKRVFRRCPGDRQDVEIQSEGKIDDHVISPYEGRAQDV